MNYELTQDPDKAAVIPSFLDADRVGRGYCERPRPAHQFKIESAPRGLKGYVVKIYPLGASSYSPDRRWLREASVRCVKPQNGSTVAELLFIGILLLLIFVGCAQQIHPKRLRRVAELRSTDTPGICWFQVEIQGDSWTTHGPDVVGWTAPCDSFQIGDSVWLEVHK